MEDSQFVDGILDELSMEDSQFIDGETTLLSLSFIIISQISMFTLYIQCLNEPLKYSFLCKYFFYEDCLMPCSMNLYGSL